MFLEMFTGIISKMAQEENQERAEDAKIIKRNQIKIADKNAKLQKVTIKKNEMGKKHFDEKDREEEAERVKLEKEQAIRVLKGENE
jgi:hypothetical protein